MPVAVVVGPLWCVHFSKVADIDRLLVILMHIIDESQVIVGVGMPCIDLSANLKVFYCHGILLLLEVSQAQVVLKLCVLCMELTGLLKGLDSLVIVVHLV